MFRCSSWLFTAIYQEFGTSLQVQFYSLRGFDYYFILVASTRHGFLAQAALLVSCSLDVLSKILSAFPTSNPSRLWNSLTCSSNINGQLLHHASGTIHLRLKPTSIKLWLPLLQEDSYIEATQVVQQIRCMSRGLIRWHHQKNRKGMNLLLLNFAAKDHQDSLKWKR